MHTSRELGMRKAARDWGRPTAVFIMLRQPPLVFSIGKNAFNMPRKGRQTDEQTQAQREILFKGKRHISQEIGMLHISRSMLKE